MRFGLGLPNVDRSVHEVRLLHRAGPPRGAARISMHGARGRIAATREPVLLGTQDRLAEAVL
jgi:hypothetical protein